MSKKNNKSRSKAYGEFLKEHEKVEAERRKHKQMNRDTNRMTSNVVDEISEITLNLEKEDKMVLENTSSKKKSKVKAQKHKANK